MRSCSTVTFCKLRACPSSGALLRYHEATLPREEGRLVREHVASCDFCGAELQLLSKFPPKDAPVVQPAPIPWNLYRLAKDLRTLSTSGTLVLLKISMRRDLTLVEP